MVIFVSGIGTDVGKSWATGWLARHFAAQGKSVITQKFIQTGNREMSEDIMLHRKIMGIPLQEQDLRHVTCPVILSYPASPHLSARIDNTRIDLDAITEASRELQREFDVVIVEGAGGIMVPISEETLTIDYIAERNLPLAFVTNGRLGSISDTLLALEAIRTRGINLYAVLYNPHFDADKIIADDAREYIRRAVAHRFPDAKWLVMPDEI